MVQGEYGLTALAEGIGEVAAVSGEATVYTDVDARVAGNLYAACVERSVSGPVHKLVYVSMVEGRLDCCLINGVVDRVLLQWSLDALLVERNDRHGHYKFCQGSWRGHDVRVVS